jgi:cytochrome c oxidase assembly protein subunit 15
VIGVIAQAIVGGLVVLLELAPVSVIAHFALSMILNMAAFVLWRRARNVSDSYPTRVPPSTRLLARFTIAATVVALAAGTIVTGTGPHAGDDRAARLNLDLIWTIRVHSAAVWTLLVLVLLTIRSVFRAQDPQLRVAMRAPMTMLLAVLLAQGALGYVQYFMGVPAVLVAFHVAGSIAVWLAVLRFALPLVSRPSINLRSEVDLRTSAQSTTDQLAPHTR